MALAHAQLLINASVEGTQKLTTNERRLCIQFLIATRPELTNQAMAEMFGVTERTIRLDKVWIRSQKAKFLKDEMSKDLSLVIADIAMDFEKQVGDIEKSKAKAKLGSRSFVDHCNSVFDMRLKMVKAFQDIGYLPKNLGNMTVDKFEYKATVNQDGASITRPADMKFGIDKDEIPDAEFQDVEEKVAEEPAQLPPMTIERAPE